MSPANLEVFATLLAGGLHRGEAEAIALAVERRADRLLIDERQGRLTAEALGVPVVGSVGVLIAAKVRGDIAAIAPLLLALRSSALFFQFSLNSRQASSLAKHQPPALPVTTFWVVKQAAPSSGAHGAVAFIPRANRSHVARSLIHIRVPSLVKQKKAWFTDITFTPFSMRNRGSVGGGVG